MGSAWNCSRSCFPNSLAWLCFGMRPIRIPLFLQRDANRRPILGIEVQSLEVRGPDDFDGIFEAARRQHPEALITVEDPLTVSHRKRIADFAAGQQLPSLHGFREFVTAGGLISYGASMADLYRRAAGYVDKIFKGAKPATCRCSSRPSSNWSSTSRPPRRSASTVPPTLLARADEVIE